MMLLFMQHNPSRCIHITTDESALVAVKGRMRGMAEMALVIQDIDVGGAGELAWTVQLSSPVLLPVAIHSIQLPGRDRARTAALVTPQRGKTAVLELTSGSLLAESSAAIHHTASPAMLPSATGAGALRHIVVLWHMLY